MYKIAGAGFSAEPLVEGRGWVPHKKEKEAGWTDLFRLVKEVLYDMENDPEQNVDVTRKHLAWVKEMKEAELCPSREALHHIQVFKMNPNQF